MDHDHTAANLGPKFVKKLLKNFSRGQNKTNFVVIGALRLKTLFLCV